MRSYCCVSFCEGENRSLNYPPGPFSLSSLFSSYLKVGNDASCDYSEVRSDA